jgi:hypothetical protein
MEEKNKRIIKEKKGLNDYIVTLVTILIVVCLGLLAVNLTLKFVYTSQLLQTPCELCAKLNPQQSDCVQGCFNYKVQVYPLVNNDYNKEINLRRLIDP